MSDSSSEDVVQESSPGSSVVSEAASAPAVEQTPSVLDAVEAALKEGVEAGPPPAGNRSEEPTATPEGQKPGEGEISPEELRQYSPNAQNRIRELAALKNELTGKNQELSTQVEEFKGKAEAFEKFSGYLASHGISTQEANNAIEITRLIKSHDYDGAMKLVEPIFYELARRSGKVLDPDLVEDVRLGKVDKNRALELQRLRMTNAVSKTRDTERASRDQQSQKAEEARNWKGHVRTVATAADDWAKQKADSDPDWNRKQDLVANAVEVIVRREGFPKTEEAMLDMNERALKQVEDQLRRFVPAPRPVNPNRGHSGPASPGNEAPPKSALEALERALRTG